jgi:hypothetical protein
MESGPVVLLGGLFLPCRPGKFADHVAGTVKQFVQSDVVSGLAAGVGGQIYRLDELEVGLQVNLRLMWWPGM